MSKLFGPVPVVFIWVRRCDPGWRLGGKCLVDGALVGLSGVVWETVPTGSAMVTLGHSPGSSMFPAELVTEAQFTAQRELPVDVSPGFTAAAFRDPGQQQHQPADEHVRADAVFEAVEDRAEQQLGLEVAEAAFGFDQLRRDTEGRRYYRRRLNAGKTPMEALRALKRRLSAIVYRQVVTDAKLLRSAREDTWSRLCNPAADLNPEIDTSESHFPDPPHPSLEQPSPRPPG